MMKILAISALALQLLMAKAYAASFALPAKTTTMPSRCTQDPLIQVNDAVLRASWAFRCNLLDRVAWQANFPSSPNRANYPVFATPGANPQVSKPDYSSCAIPAGVTFYEVCENGTLIFDAQSRTFGAGQTWDASGSQARLLETGKSIRFTLFNQDLWAAAAYVFNSDYSFLDLGRYSRLHLRLKNSGYGAQARLLVYLVDMDGHDESIRLPVTIDRTFNDYMINLEQISLNGFNTARSQALVIAVSEPGTQKFEVDLEKISAD